MIEYSEYKGHPIIKVTAANSKTNISFGTAKAMAILAHVDEIRAWVAKNNESELSNEVDCPDCGATWIWASDMPDMPYAPKEYSADARCPMCKDAERELIAKHPEAIAISGETIYHEWETRSQDVRRHVQMTADELSAIHNYINAQDGTFLWSGWDERDIRAYWDEYAVRYHLDYTPDGTMHISKTNHPKRQDPFYQTMANMYGLTIEQVQAGYVRCEICGAVEKSDDGVGVYNCCKKCNPPKVDPMFATPSEPTSKKSALELKPGTMPGSTPQRNQKQIGMFTARETVTFGGMKKAGMGAVVETGAPLELKCQDTRTAEEIAEDQRKAEEALNLTLPFMSLDQNKEGVQPLIVPRKTMGIATEEQVAEYKRRTEAVKPTRYVSVTDTAKLIRADLKNAYPDVKFSVRSAKFSMGTSIDVEWTDGPTIRSVDALVNRYKSSEFDGMTDTSTTIYQEDPETGEQIHYGAKYVMTQRNYSKSMLTMSAALVAKEYHAARIGETFTIETHEDGSAYIKQEYTPDGDEARRLIMACVEKRYPFDHDGSTDNDNGAAEEVAPQAIPKTAPKDSKTPVKTLKFDDETLDVLRDVEWADDGKSAVITQQLYRKLYEKVNKALEAMGGKWNRKAKSHLFTTDPRESVEGLIESGQIVVEKDGFFETPPDLASRMAQKADLFSFDRVLEPSAGLGNIAWQIREASAIAVCVERNENRAKHLRDNDFDTTCTDFMQYEPAEAFDAVIMNPPFEVGQDMDHVQRAYGMLKYGGRLVAVMSEGPFFREDKKASGFRSWMEMVGGTSEKLPEGTFKVSGTGVNTRMVVIDKQLKSQDTSAVENLVAMKKASWKGCTAPRVENVIKWSDEQLARYEEAGKYLDDFLGR